MKKLSIALILSVFLLVPHTTYAQDVPEYIKSLVINYAEKYRVYKMIPKMIAILRCESDFNPAAIGDHGESFGIAQIHLPAHPSVTKEMAFDPKFSIEMMAAEFSEGNQDIWSCYKIISLATTK